MERMENAVDLRGKNLILSEECDQFLNKLQDFGIVQQGHFEYKKLTADGRHYHGEYFINFRLLTTRQEMELAPFYERAINKWFGDKKNLLIVGVAMGSLLLPKVIQYRMFETTGVEFAYAEKRNGILSLCDEQARKCRGKHLLFIEDVCNFATSLGQLLSAIGEQQEALAITGFSVLYGVHRGHTFVTEPAGEIYALSLIHAPAYHPDELPDSFKNIPLQLYKK